MGADINKWLIDRVLLTVAEWLEAHEPGEPYEIFSGPDGSDDRRCYRLTVERIPLAV